MCSTIAKHGKETHPEEIDPSVLVQAGKKGKSPPNLLPLSVSSLNFE